MCPLERVVGGQREMETGGRDADASCVGQQPQRLAQMERGVGRGIEQEDIGKLKFQSECLASAGGARDRRAQICRGIFRRTRLPGLEYLLEIMRNRASEVRI